MLSPHASAAAVPNTVKQKAAFEGVYQCFKAGAYRASFLASQGGAGMILKDGAGDAVKLPYGLTDASDNNTNCKEILKGFHDDGRSDDTLNKGLMQQDIWNGTDLSKVVALFSGANRDGGDGSMGYKAEPVGNVNTNQTTYQLKITLADSTKDSSVCQRNNNGVVVPGTGGFYTNKGGSGPVSEIIFPIITEDTSGNWWAGDATASNGGANVPMPGSGGSAVFYFCNDESWIQVRDTGSASSPYYTLDIYHTTYPQNEHGMVITNTEPLATELVTGGKGGYDYAANTRKFIGVQSTGTVKDATDFDDFTLTYTNVSFMQPVRKLASSSGRGGAGYGLTRASTYEDLALTDREIYSLYTYYVTDVFKYPVVCDDASDYASYVSSPKINWAAGKECRVYTQSTSAARPTNVYGVDSDKHFTKPVGIQDIIDTLKNIDVAGLGDKAETGGNISDLNNGGSGDNDDSNNGSEGNNDVYPCLEAAESLGWVLCPVLDFLGRATDILYEKVEDSFLVVNAGMLGDDTHEAWQKFLNFANTLFIIVFLVVILSQVTGFGISNYGVKKILPRLVVMAVLVNISFILCQLAVDVSNIVGAEAKDILGKLGGVHPDGEMGVGAIITQILSVLGFMGVAVNLPAIAANAGETLNIWLLPILVTFGGFLVGIFFAGILLAVRQAGVIILIVLSPIAIISYALPNTKFIFDKWRKAFISLLLVYPLCGIIVGGGQFATSLLINNNGGFFYTLVAMLLSIVPFFFIPSMVRSSLSALGNIGTKISGAGQRFSRWAQGMARNSELYKDAQRSLDKRSAERIVRNINRREAEGRRISGRQQRRRSRALSRGIGLVEEDERAGADTRAFPSDRTPEGRAALDSIRAKYREDALEERVKEEAARYRNSGELDVNNVDNLEGELDRLIDALDANPNDATASAQLRAIQDFLMAQGDPGQEALFRSYMKRAERGGASSGLHAAARHIASNGKYMQKIKNEDKGLFAAVNDFKMGKTDIGPGATNYYGAQGAGGYTAQTLAGADMGAIRRLTESIKSGAISGNDLGKLSALANEALSSENISIKGDVRQELENLVAASYATGGDAAGSVTAGATALNGASLETLGAISQRIRNINGGAKFTTVPTSGPALDQYNEAQAMAQNAINTLMDADTIHDAAAVTQLQEVIASARAMGVKDMGGADFSNVDPAAIKVRGVEKRTVPPVPTGWTASGLWSGSGTPTEQQKIAYQEWAKKAAEVEMWNKEHNL